VKQVDDAIRSLSCSLEVVIVDDGSVVACDPREFSGPFSSIAAIRVVRLRRNLGHQRAIAIGLAHLATSASYDAILVMDADGEDTPAGVMQLIEAFRSRGATTAVFAERVRRSESFGFRFFYRLYRWLHYLLTGVAVRVGNFSIVPFSYLRTLLVVSELWNHYAAAIHRSGLPFVMVPIPRGHRIAGRSTMNVVSLVTHGLSAISVFGDIVGVRLLIASVLGAVVAAICVVVVIGIRLFTSSAIPGWATYAAGTLTVIVIQLMTVATSFTLFMLFSRFQIGFVPLRDHELFVADVAMIYSA
jgi:polyisoprenyl-phosphate glycosyltransferase